MAIVPMELDENTRICGGIWLFSSLNCYLVRDHFPCGMLRTTSLLREREQLLGAKSFLSLKNPNPDPPPPCTFVPVTTNIAGAGKPGWSQIPTALNGLLFFGEVDWAKFRNFTSLLFGSRWYHRKFAELVLLEL